MLATGQTAQIVEHIMAYKVYGLNKISHQGLQQESNFRHFSLTNT